MICSIRFVLDVILFVLLLTLFKRHVISADYHVWAGLVYCGLLIWHIWLNRQWLQQLIGRKKKGLDWLVLGLILVWILLLVTGILTAKQFGIEWHFLKPYHKFLGAISLLLVAAHIGFHWQYLKDHILQCCGFLRKVPAALATLALVGTLCLGGYGFVDSGYAKWISAPFTVAARPAADAAQRRPHKPRPFSWERLGKSMAEIAGMMFLGAYVVKCARKPPGKKSGKG
ncbi:hypothetical protein SAMN02910356_00573 [Selenomonas sp. GACV-9]|uniref:DUF4405 domain-containing protein n=1 Tax=Selenomonas sp. GACV-9 TaxID=3158782 RepID=UPI0008E6051C|nr:hypothetical protein SAMN02910356_00573 [Selenomonas ruminantium]